MQTFRRFFAPPVFDEQDKTNKAFLLNFIVLAYFTALTLVSMLAYLAAPDFIATTQALILALGPFLIVLVVVQILMRRGRVQEASVLFAVFQWLNVTYTIYTSGGVTSYSLASYFLSVLIFGLLLGNRYSIAVSVLSLISAIVMMALDASGLLPEYMPDQQEQVISAFLNFATFIFLATALLYLYLRQLDETLKSLNETLKSLEEAKNEIEKRAQALATSAEVSRRLSTILNQKELIEEVVTQVQQSFDYYHAHIYLVDGDELLMAGGTGEAGAAMLESGHKIPTGRGLVGRAAETNEPVLVPDVSQSIGWLPNPLLPDTKSEAAVPISVGGQILGVLDVQHNIVDGLDENDVTLLQSLASQIAIALQNARQYEDNLRFRLGIENSGDAIFTTDTNGTITYANPAFEKVYGYASTEVIGQNPRIIKSGLLSQEVYQHFWNTMLSKQPVTGEIVNKHKNGNLVYIAGTNSAIVNDAGEITGFLAVHHDITEQKTNQKLTERRASQQEAINLITQKIQGTTSMQEALQITARELGRALGKKQTLVTLESTALDGDGKGMENK